MSVVIDGKIAKSMTVEISTQINCVVYLFAILPKSHQSQKNDK